MLVLILTLKQTLIKKECYSSFSSLQNEHKLFTTVHKKKYSDLKYD